MSAIFDFFDTVLSFFEMAFNFVWTIISSLISAIGVIGSSLSFGYAFVGFMPTFLATSFFVFLFIYLVKFFVGR